MPWSLDISLRSGGSVGQAVSPAIGRLKARPAGSKPAAASIGVAKPIGHNESAWRPQKMPKSRSTTVKLPPVHPGEILKETLDDLGLTENQLAQTLHVPANRISAYVSGKRSITGDTALRLARYFRTTPAYWMNLQARFDLDSAK
jgi:antitoxin HigA-1